jgi:serine/threonine protein kinase
MESKGYKLKNKIGEGAFGAVYLVKDKDGENCAVKDIDKEKLEEDGYCSEYFLTEINSMLNIKSENVVNLKEIFEDEESIFMVMEYCEKRLYSYLA